MPDIPTKDMRDCCVRAMAGNHAAARTLLKIFSLNDVAREVHTGRPFSNKVRRAVDALGAGCGDPNWEIINADGSVENLLWHEPPSVARDHLFDGDD